MSFSFRKSSFDPNAPRTYVLDSVSPDPENPIKLLVKHAGNGNPGFISAVLKRDAALEQKYGAKETASSTQARREADVAIYADHIVVGWENVEEDGKPAPCEADTVKRFLDALVAPPPEGRPDVFDRLRLFTRDPENFSGARMADALGKG